MKFRKFNLYVILGFLLVITAMALAAPALASDTVCANNGSLQGCITNNHDGTATGVIMNSGPNSFDVGMASYSKFSNPISDSLPDQELFDHQLGNIGANGEVTFTITIPDCSTQIDLFIGELIYQFSGQNDRYAERLIAALHIDTDPCDDGSGEGCTPGYWKNHDGFWHDPDGASYYDVFATDIEGFAGSEASQQVKDAINGAIGNITLGQALEVKGNKNKYEALVRHSTAAILSAGSPGTDYELFASQVIALTRQAWAAWAAGDKNTVENIKNQLDALNNSGCDLGRNPF
jgi:hypothetical protein